MLTASHWGLFYAKTKDGRLVAVRPFEGDRAPSPNLSSLVEHPYSSARIQTPMVRRSYLEKGSASRAGRGADEYVPVSWDKALDLAAGELRRIYETYGPSAVWGRSYGWKSTGSVNNAIALMQRLLSLLGGWVETGNSYSTAAISTILPYAVGGKLFKPTVWPVIKEKTERIVFRGCDPLITNDIEWATTLHQGIAEIRKLKDHPRIRTIAVNPLRPKTADVVGSRWMPVRAGTDAALMLVMMYVLITENRLDRAFLANCVTGWNEMEAYILGTEDGVKKTPEWAEIGCGVPAQQIQSFARELSEHRSMIMFGWGPQRARYGEQPPWMAVALACALGQIGLPGGGIGVSYHYESGGWPVGKGPVLGQIPARPKAVWQSAVPWKGSRAVPVARMADVLACPGKVIDWNGSRIEYPDIRLVFWSGGNPFAHHPDTRALEAAWRRPETVIVTDAFWSATARHADIVLPAATTLERNDISPIGTSTNDGIVFMRQVINPVGEARSDYKIYSELAKRLGLGDTFTEGLDEAGWIQRLYEEAAAAGVAQNAALPAFADFVKNGVHLYAQNPAETRFTAFADFRADPEAHPLRTESGKIVIYSKRIEALHYADAPAHPTWIPPFAADQTSVHGQDAQAQEERKEGLGDWLELVSPKSGARLHSQLNPVTSARSNIAGREPCEMNSVDAAKRGSANGDVVKVSRLRGAILAGAVVTDGVRAGTIVVRHGGWFDPQESSDGAIDANGCANVLTPDDPASALSNGNIASTALVQVEKWRGELLEVRAFNAPHLGK